MIKIHIIKMVSDWSETEGAGTKSWLTLDEIEYKPLEKVLYNYGLDLKDFEDVTDDLEPEGTLDRRLEYCRTENGDGDASDRGEYLADYSVYVSTYTETKTEPINTKVQ